MGQSIIEYLERLSTERLENFLWQYYNGSFTEDFSYVVPYVENILARRSIDI